MKEVICGIYEIVNKVNGKKYIGQSIDIYSRFKSHRNSLRKGNSKCTLLQRAWNKYGEESFEFYILEECDEDVLDIREKYYISLFNTQDNGYNIENGGNTNKHLPQETRDKLRDAHLGKTASQETRAKMAQSRMGDKNPMYGKHHSQEVRDLISIKNIGKTGHKISESQRQKAREVNTGKILSQETRDRISESNKGKTPHNKNERPVLCIELNIIFNCASDAAKQLNITSYGILECCRHNRNTCGGYHWEYADEITDHYEYNELAV